MRKVMLMTGLLILPAPLTAQSILEQIQGALRLPTIATDARQSGVPDDQVTGVLEQIRRRRLPAGDASRVMDEELRAVREGGPTNNFGAFVQSRLDAGLRGRELAEAIRAEHARRGIGRPDDAGQGRQPDRARPDDAGQRQPERGRRDTANAAQPAQRGGRP
jgi:hypothetical protein